LDLEPGNNSAHAVGIGVQDGSLCRPRRLRTRHDQAVPIEGAGLTELRNQVSLEPPQGGGFRLQSYNVALVDTAGRHATVFVASERPAVVSHLEATTNHGSIRSNTPAVPRG
jgi:hypothetical protein